MSEEPATYDAVSRQDLEDAEAMLGTGYREPSIVIEPERTRIERRNGKLEEVEKAAWVKFSTAFKKELPLIDESALKVFIFLALSIGREDNKARPGTRAIADGTGLSKNTVTSALRRLEELGLLQISRLDGQRSTFEPVLVSANEESPTVPNFGTVPLSQFQGELSQFPEGLSQFGGATVPTVIPKNAQPEVPEDDQKNQKEAAAPHSRNLVDGIIHYHIHPKAVQQAIATHFKLTPNWETKFNRQFMEWAVEQGVQPSQVELAAGTWRKDKRFNWSAPSLKGIQEHWLELIASGTPSAPEASGLDTNGFPLPTQEQLDQIAKELAPYCKR